MVSLDCSWPPYASGLCLPCCKTCPPPPPPPPLGHGESLPQALLGSLKELCLLLHGKDRTLCWSTLQQPRCLQSRPGLLPSGLLSLALLGRSDSCEALHWSPL